MSLLLGLLAFAGANAIGAIFSLVVIAQYFAYSIPISARFLGGKGLKPGPFSLGRFVGGIWNLLWFVLSSFTELSGRFDSSYVDGLHHSCLPFPFDTPSYWCEHELYGSCLRYIVSWLHCILLCHIWPVIFFSQVALSLFQFSTSISQFTAVFTGLTARYRPSRTTILWSRVNYLIICKANTRVLNSWKMKKCSLSNLLFLSTINSSSLRSY